VINKKIILLFITFFALFLSYPCNVLADTPDINEGNWTITVTMSVQGTEMPPQTYTNCLKKEDSVPFDTDPQSPDCNPENVKTSGDTVSWTIDCKGMTGKGSITYYGDSFRGDIIISNGQSKMIQHLEGRRTGPCTE
jgi:uncharacterized protein DUF3617